MNSPLVSIIICCYNRAHLLPATLQSAFDQIYSPVEILVIDDGSTDDTSTLISNFGNRIRYHRQENQGISVARTTGAKIARGEFIAYLDDDDLMPPNRISLLLNALVDFPSAVMSVGDWQEMDHDGNLTQRRTSFLGNRHGDAPVFIENSYEAVLWPYLTPIPHTTLFRKRDGERIGWFDTSFSHACEDTDFFARLADLGGIVYVPEIVSYYRKLGNSLSSNSLLMEYSRLHLLEKHIAALKDTNTALRKRLQERLFYTLLNTTRLFQKTNLPQTEIPHENIRRYLKLLPLKNKLKYQTINNIVLPLKKALASPSRP